MIDVNYHKANLSAGFPLLLENLEKIRRISCPRKIMEFWDVIKILENAEILGTKLKCSNPISLFLGFVALRVRDRPKQSA